jgi:hypothetical protein
VGEKDFAFLRKDLTMVAFSCSFVRRSFLIALGATTFVSFSNAQAEVLFEGYSKILASGAQIGYIVQRYEFDEKKKEFSNIYLIRTNANGGNLTESLKARASASFKPVSYQYTSLAGDKATTIDATFKDETMTAIVKSGGKQNTITKKLPKGTFLSGFLAYLMLQSKEGIKVGVKYGYQAIAEEDANVYTGEAYIKNEEKVGSISSFKVLNTFKGTQFVSYFTHKGEVIATNSPVQKISTELVPTMQEATTGFPMNASNLALLFGSVPKGIENAVSRRASAAPSSAVAKSPSPSPTAQPKGKATGKENAAEELAPEHSAKKNGVPGGTGAQLKTGEKGEKGEKGE